jgi:hypothetical protein
VLYDGAHNLRFSAISASPSRISRNPRNYRESFAYLRHKYRTELGSLTPWQRRHFRAQSKLIEASKYLEQADHAEAMAQMLLAASFYPPILGRLARAVFRRLSRGDSPIVAHSVAGEGSQATRERTPSRRPGQR